MSSNTTDSSTSTDNGFDETEQLWQKLQNFMCSEYLASSCILVFVLICFIAYEVRMKRAKKFSFFTVSLSLLCVFGSLIGFDFFFNCSIPSLPDFSNPSLALWHIVYYTLMYVRSSALIEKDWMKKAVLYYSAFSVTVFAGQCLASTLFNNNVFTSSDPIILNLMAVLGITSSIMMASTDYYYLYLFQSLKSRTEECLKFPIHLQVLMQYGSYCSALIILEFIGVLINIICTNEAASIGAEAASIGVIIFFATFTAVPVVLFFMRIRLDKENAKKSSTNGATTTKDNKYVKSAAVSLQK